MLLIFKIPEKSFLKIAEDNNISVIKGKQAMKKKAACIIFIIVILVYLAGYIFFRDRFFFHTFINGADCSMKTVSEVMEEIEKETDCTKVKIQFRDGETFCIYGQAFDYKCPSEEIVSSLLNEQDKWCWPASVLYGNDHIFPGSYSFNKEKLSKILMMSSRLDEKNMVKPENAHISFSEKDKMFVIVPETEGTAINIKTFWETLCDSLANKREPLSHKDIVVDILKEGLYETAEIKKDSASLNKKTDELNGLTSGSITYRLPDSGTMTLDRSVCRNWLVYEDGEYSYDEDLWYENAGLYVDELAQRANTVWKERVFDSTEHGEITVPGGTYGYSVDIEEETDAILDTIGSGQDEEREPIYASEEDEEYEVNSGIGDTYIEVSIDDQHLWFYKDGKLVLDTDIVTGNRGNHDTPTGVYRILYTQRNATLKGRIMSNGEPEYVTKVSYWMPFYDGCGFHDANWRRSFGGSIYRWNGSHGCVNMPPAKAAELHDYVQAGTIAVIY